jgi:hypothetical protein
LSGSANIKDDDIGIELLRDIRTEWPSDEPFIGTQNLLARLHALEERPWATWGRTQKPMTPRALAVRLERFGIQSRSTGAVRGYDQASFIDSWSRYKLAPPPHEPSNRQAVNKSGAWVTDALTVQPGDRGQLREWTDAEIDAMEQAGQQLRPDYLERLQRLSDTAKLNSGS